MWNDIHCDHATHTKPFVPFPEQSGFDITLHRSYCKVPVESLDAASDVQSP